jgi:formylglycine-generating enzyme required for sulfatase activity
MKFVPVEGTDVLFCTWETRVRDFTAFIEATDYDAMGGMLSFDGEESTWHRRGASWRLPGFDQSADHPVVGINWYDANAFCAWLTLHERRAGVIADDQQYRLPYDAEWSAAVGRATYAWGEQWPPPLDAGNFLGEEARPVQLRVLENFHDGAPRTTRVARFASNRFGLHDLAGAAKASTAKARRWTMPRRATTVRCAARPGATRTPPICRPTGDIVPS